MKHCQVNQQGNLNFQNLFADYNAAADFAAASNAPLGISAGNPLGRGTSLLTNQSTMLSLNGGVASVVGLMTCTALIAKCGANSNYFVAHLNVGHVDADMQNKLRQFMRTYPNDTPQAVYVIPDHSMLQTYAADVNILSGLGYDVCFVTNPNRNIGSVHINGNGDLCIS